MFKLLDAVRTFVLTECSKHVLFPNCDHFLRSIVIRANSQVNGGDLSLLGAASLAHQTSCSRERYRCSRTALYSGGWYHGLLVYVVPCGHSEWSVLCESSTTVEYAARRVKNAEREK